MEKILDTQFKLSAEVFCIQVGSNRYLIYAPLRKAAFVANSAVVNLIADLKKGNEIQFTETNNSVIEFLERMQIVNSGEEVLPITTYSDNPEPTELTLFMTTACNLRCTYCYASAGETPLKNMTMEVASKGIDFIIQNAIKTGSDHIAINYHGGGEPTVNWKILTESFRYAKEKAGENNLQLKSSCSTNGVLNENQIEWIVNNLGGVSISYDGLPEIQDKNRITVSGKGSSAKVLNTLRSFDAIKFNYGIRLTVTHDLIKLLPSSIEFLCSNFRPMAIQVEPAFQMGRWKEAPSAETQEFIDSFRVAQRIAKSFNQDISFSGARLGSLSNHFCGISQDSFCLTPDGNVSGCYEAFSETTEWAKKFIYGSFDESDSGYSFDFSILDNLRNQAVQLRDYCKGCFAKWSCGGDCYHKSLTVNGDVEFEGTDRCHIIRELTKDQILEKISSSGNYFWHDDEQIVLHFKNS